MPAAERLAFLRRLASLGRRFRPLTTDDPHEHTGGADGVRRPLLGYVVHGAGGLHAPSAHVRVVQRVELLAAAGRVDVAQVDAGAWARGTGTVDPDVLLVQRDAVPEADLDAFLARIRATGTRLVAEVDDDFFTDAARERLGRAEYDPGRLRSVTEVVRAAAVTIVSTAALAEAVRGVGGRPVVVGNQVDPRLWTGPVDAGDAREAAVGDVGDTRTVHRVLYAGSRTHSADLALLRPVFDGLVAADGLPVRLEVVGVSDEPADWYDDLPVPDAAGHYPAFVRWLRAHATRWDAAVAPLVDEPFNRSKSDLKFVEYTLLGLPVVLSDVGPYREHAARAVVVPNRTGAWRSAVADAVALGGPTPAADEHVRTQRLIGSDVAWERALGL
ncbi:hypothetical protein HP467_07905 [Curtobacterium albidum]|uniref:Uncharacterized protein n=1 Tax=Curtobacterium citreum TaxID=2036 RepID=A0A850DU80_9MICO|nr:hypothetical protein [Curtobacterium albidum]NUU28035.1 hypothetical protein [Curtobacterium albidum]